MDSMLLALALTTASCLTYNAPNRGIPKGHAHLGLLIVLLSFFDFGFEISRFINWRVSVNASICTM